MILSIILIPYLVSLLVFDLASVILYSHSSSSIKEVLELACFRARASGLFTRVQETFPGPHQAYSLEQYDAFISDNRLGMSHVFTSNTFLLIDLVFHH